MRSQSVEAAMAFAESLIWKYAGSKYEAKDIFAAYVGAVASRDIETASICLKALDEGLDI